MAGVPVLRRRVPGRRHHQRLFVLTSCWCRRSSSALLGVHLAILWRQKHTQFPGPGRTERNVVGLAAVADVRGRDRRAVRRVAAVLVRPRRPGPDQSGVAVRAVQTAGRDTAAQPDWYMGWLEGALRIFRRGGSTSSATRSRSCSGPASPFPASRSGCCTCGRSSRPASRMTTRAPPARPAPRPPGAHGHRRRRADLLHRAVRRRRPGHHRPEAGRG